jgi:hypothetical protein
MPTIIVNNVEEYIDEVNNNINRATRSSSNRSRDITVIRSLLPILRRTPVGPGTALWNSTMAGDLNAFITELTGGAVISPAQRTNLSTLVNELRTLNYDPQADALNNLLGPAPTSAAPRLANSAILFMGELDRTRQSYNGNDHQSLNQHIEEIFTDISDNSSFSHINFFIVDLELSARASWFGGFSNLMQRPNQPNRLRDITFPSVIFLTHQIDPTTQTIISNYHGTNLLRINRYNEINRPAIERFLRAYMKPPRR